MNPEQKFQAAMKSAEGIFAKAKAEGRELTKGELDEVQKHLDEAEALKKYVATEKRAKSFRGGLGLDDSDAEDLLPQDRAGGGAWAKSVQAAIEERVGTRGAKALLGGTLEIPSIITQDPVLINGKPTRVLDLIPRRSLKGVTGLSEGMGAKFSFFRQVTRSLGASGVPDGAKKPKSEIDFTEIEDRYRVYAHTAGPIPKRFLDDYRRFIEVLRVQLGEGLKEALEFDILNGSGTPTAEVLETQTVLGPEDVEIEIPTGDVETYGDDPVKGLLNTSGVRTQAYATSVLNTLSAARYVMEDNFEAPNAWLMSSADVRALEMLTETGTGAFLFGSGRSTLQQVLGDYPIVTTPHMAQGEALLGNFDMTELIVREDDHLDIDGSGELFKRNQVEFRHEGRYGFAVLKPSAFIKVDLTA